MSEKEKDIDQNLVSVKILDRYYQINCPVEKETTLQHAADLLNKEMQTARKDNNCTPIEIAVIAALNICHDLIQSHQQKQDYIKTTHQRIQEFEKRIEHFLKMNANWAIKDSICPQSS